MLRPEVHAAVPACLPLPACLPACLPTCLSICLPACWASCLPACLPVFAMNAVFRVVARHDTTLTFWASVYVAAQNPRARAGVLRPGGVVVEGTAGNTGIGLAHICNARGYKCVIYMPDTQARAMHARDDARCMHAIRRAGRGCALSLCVRWRSRGRRWSCSACSGPRSEPCPRCR